jgi:hypothetical protein
MQYDLSHQLVDEAGKPAIDETGAPAPLKPVLARAILTDTADNAKSKWERFELWIKLREAELVVDFTTEEAKLLKDAASVYPTLIFGQIVKWLEGHKI